MKVLNPRIFAWDRFVDISESFKQTFFDCPTRVKNKCALESFETLNGILEWEWRVIDSLITEGDVIPPPQGPDSLRVYLVIFRGHPDHGALVRMRDGHTPLDRDLRWGAYRAVITPSDIQAYNQRLEAAYASMKKEIRVWLKRWNYRPTKWLSRRRSAVCNELRERLLLPHTPTNKRPRVVGWLEAQPTAPNPIVTRVEDDIRRKF